MMLPVSLNEGKISENEAFGVFGEGHIHDTASGQRIQSLPVHSLCLCLD